MKKYLLFLFVFCNPFILVKPLQASSALTQLFNSFASSTNVTSPGSYQDQAAGYYTGGGLMMRNRTTHLRPITLSLPHIGADCRGIDAYFGGFSFIKGQQLVNMLRNLGSAAATYGFQLALKTMSPQIESLVTQIRNIALKASQFATNECHLAQQMFAATMPKGSIAHKEACIAVEAQGLDEPDWFGARESCQKDPARIDNAIAEQKADNPDLLIGDYNLTWEAMKKVPGLMDDKDLAQYMMSVIGTIISRRVSDGTYDVFTKEGRGDSLDFIKANLEETSTEILVCDEPNECLDPTWQKVPISQNKKLALIERVRRLITSIQGKYITKEKLDEEELNFLANGHNVPIYRYIQISAAAGSDFLMDDACYYMAISLILQQFESFAQKMLSYLDTLEQKQKDTSHIEKLRNNIRSLRSRLHQIHARADNGASQRLFQKIRTYEKMIAAR